MSADPIFKQFQRRFMTMLELLIGMALTMVLLSVLTFFYQQVEQLNGASEKAQKEIFRLQYAENRLSQVLTQAIPEAPGGVKFFTSGNLSGILSENNPSLVFQYETGTDLDNDRAVTALGRLFVDKNNRLCLATWPDPTEWEKKGIEQTLKAHIEVLLDNVTSMRFHFFVAPERDRSLLNNKNAPGNQGMDKTATEKKSDEQQNKQTARDKVRAAKAEASKTDQKKDVEGNTSTTNAAPAAPKDQTEEESNAIGVISEPELKGLWVTEWSRDYKQLPSMIKIEIKQKDKETPYVFAFPFLKSKDVIVYEQ